MFKIETKEQVEILRTKLTLEQIGDLLYQDSGTVDCDDDRLSFRAIYIGDYLPWTVNTQEAWPKGLLEDLGVSLGSEEETPND